MIDRCCIVVMQVPMVAVAVTWIVLIPQALAVISQQESRIC